MTPVVPNSADITMVTRAAREVSKESVIWAVIVLAPSIP